MTISPTSQAKVDRACDNYLAQLQIAQEDGGMDEAVFVAKAMLTAVMGFMIQTGETIESAKTLVMQFAENMGREE
jgi:hypothetical protein